MPWGPLRVLPDGGVESVLLHRRLLADVLQVLQREKLQQLGQLQQLQQLGQLQQLQHIQQLQQLGQLQQLQQLGQLQQLQRFQQHELTDGQQQVSHGRFYMRGGRSQQNPTGLNYTLMKNRNETCLTPAPPCLVV